LLKIIEQDEIYPAFQFSMFKGMKKTFFIGAVFSQVALVDNDPAWIFD
jgi:hypothetical protein